MPGHLEVGDDELELHPTEGHTADGMAIWIPWAQVLVAATTSRRSRCPMLSETGSRDAYLATLRRLETLVEQADARRARATAR